jgi:hypothetical protein
MSYDEIAGLLHTDAGAVRRRAHGAVDALGPNSAGLSSDRRHEIADYLLGQQTASQRAATREYLDGSSAARLWARAAASELAPLAGDATLPDIPPERKQVAEAIGAPRRPTTRQEDVQPSSQLGGRLIAGGLGLVLAIVIILVVSLSGGDDGGSPSAATTSTTTTSTTTIPTLGGDPQILAQGVLHPPKGNDSPSGGQVAIVLFRESDRYRLALTANRLPPSSTDSSYGVWFYTSPGNALFLGFPDKVVDTDGKLNTVADLSPKTPNYREVLLTRERTDARPSKPGTVLLRARLVIATPRGRSQTQTAPG